MHPLSALVGFFFFSLAFAFFGHLLWRFYGFLWRSLIGLLGFKPKEAAAVAVPGESGGLEASLRRGLREHGLQLLGLGGALLAVAAVFWLLGDLVSSERLQRWIQFGALLLLTAALAGWGYRLRSRQPDLLGTGAMLLGFLLVPVDSWFYQQFILGYSTCGVFLVLLLMSGIGFGFHRSTGSRTFAWLAPLCGLAGLLLIGYKFNWSLEAQSYFASLLTPLVLAFGLWAESRAWFPPFRNPHRSCVAVAALASLLTFLGSEPEALAWLPFLVAALAGGSLAVLAYLVSDLRGLLILLPFLGSIFYEHFSRFGTDYGGAGTAAALLALALLAGERYARQGRERSRGLEPWFSVPALALLLLAIVVDGLSVMLLGVRISDSTRFHSGQLAFDRVPYLWADVQQAVYYLARLDPTLLWTACSGVLSAASLAYLSREAGVPLFGFGAGVPLALGLASGLLWALPLELHSRNYVFPLAALACACAVAAYRLKPTSWRPAGRGCALAAHLLLPAAYLALGARLHAPYSLPAWWGVLTVAVIGFQFVLHARLAGLPTAWTCLGLALAVLAWPAAIVTLSPVDDAGVMVALVMLGLALSGGALWLSLASHHIEEAAIGATGLLLTLLATASIVDKGQIVVKLVVLAAGLALLWAGARARRSGVALLLAAALAASATQAAQPNRVVTRDGLATLGRANPDDPLIGVVLRSSGVSFSAVETTEKVWKTLRDHLGTLSGLDSIQAALQLAASPLRIRLRGNLPSFELARLTSAAPRSLDYPGLARRLPGSPSLPERAGDPLDRVPPDRIQLRFSSAEALGRVLALYEQRGRAVLAVASPGLALPSPDVAFRAALGVSLVEASAGCSAGALLIGDPSLGLAPDLALVLRFGSLTEASARAESWRQRWGQDRAAAVGEFAVLALFARTLPPVVRALDGSWGEDLSGEPDFRYASLLSISAPDARLFIGEAVVRRLVAPAFWIVSNRRDDCLAELADLEAAEAYGRLTSRPLPAAPDDAQFEAIDRKWMAPGGQCRSGGTLSRGANGVPSCSVHGSRLAPAALEAPPELIHPAEQTAYELFFQRYRQLYGQWTDPICVGVDARSGVASLEAAILPVARQPAYQTLLSWSRSWLGGEARPLITVPPAAREALAAVAVRSPLDYGGMWNQWEVGRYLRGYYRDPSLWRLETLMQPSPLGSCAGVLLLDADLTGLPSPDRLWKDPAPLPLAVFREVRQPERAAAYLKELMSGRSHRKYAGGEGYGIRLHGRRWVHAAVNHQLVGLATSEEQLDRLLSQPVEHGSLPGAGAYLSLRPAALWKAAREQRGTGAGFFLDGCRRFLGSAQNLVDLGLSWPLPASGFPRGEPFLDPSTRCPGGGEYRLEGPLVVCTLHGSCEAPRSGLPADNSPLASLMESIARVSAELAVLDDGIMTRVVLESKSAAGQ
jgi:hypothetical protein